MATVSCSNLSNVQGSLSNPIEPLINTITWASTHIILHLWYLDSLHHRESGSHHSLFLSRHTLSFPKELLFPEALSQMKALFFSFFISGESVQVCNLEVYTEGLVFNQTRTYAYAHTNCSAANNHTSLVGLRGGKGESDGWRRRALQGRNHITTSLLRSPSVSFLDGESEGEKKKTEGERDLSQLDRCSWSRDWMNKTTWGITETWKQSLKCCGPAIIAFLLSVNSIRVQPQQKRPKPVLYEHAETDIHAWMYLSIHSNYLNTCSYERHWITIILLSAGGKHGSSITGWSGRHFSWQWGIEA